jgi:hypothetical protein
LEDKLMSLPGVTTVLNDQFYLASQTNVPAGPIVAVLATRNTASGTNGIPDYDTYQATNEQDVITSFGYGSGCHRAYDELIAAGAITIFLIPIPAGTTDTELQDTSTGNPLDTAMAAAETCQPSIIVGWGRGGNPGDWINPATPSSVLPVGFFADNTTVGTTSMASRFANWGATITGRSNPVLTVLGLAPYNVINAATPDTVGSASMTAAQVATQVTFPNLVVRTDPTLTQLGQYLIIVAGEVQPVAYDPSWGYANAATTMAGALAVLPSTSAPTAKILYNVQNIRYNPTRTQQQNMINMGVNPVALNYNRTPIWGDGKTFALDTSDYTRISTMRIVYDTVTMVRQVAQQYVGQAATLEAQNALNTSISSGLRILQQQGELTASNFTIQYLPAINQANINLVLTPAFEMRNIQVTVSVSL